MLRCVVTGHQNERATVVADGPPAEVVAFASTPGMEVAKIWSTPAMPGIGRDEAGIGSKEAGFLPAIGETRFVILTFPPDSTMLHPDFDLAAAAGEFAERLPEMAAVREAADPAMHRTDTIDHIIVLEGEVWLELDDQQEVLLRQHDVAVQNGTRHAWRNKSNRPVTMAVVMVGAARRA